jgi:hypothetical protein
MVAKLIQPESIETSGDLNAFIAARQDNGCSRWGKCLTCPYSDCVAPQKELVKWRVRDHRSTSPHSSQTLLKTFKKVTKKEKRREGKVTEKVTRY